MTVGRARSSKVAAAVVAAVTLLPAPAVAGDGIAATGRRLVADAIRMPGTTMSSRAVPGTRRSVASRESAAMQPTGLTRSGLSRGKKLAIGIGLAAAFGAIVWAIDQGVEDNTPSSRGLR